MELNMYYFMNDYSEGAHPKILEAIINENLLQNPGYGNDRHVKQATDFIKAILKRNDVDIHFLMGGTQANLTVISASLRAHQAVIAPDTGHINVHETGAIEACGHKVLTANVQDGKLTPEAIQEILDYHTDEHMVQPKMVYLSDSTELGTIYRKHELQQISNICRRNQMYLFLDGARLGAALTAKENDIELSDLANLCDAFYIGGTKNGALYGEAVVLCNDTLKEDFRFIMKQKGAMLAKGWLLGIQFEELFKDGLYFELADHANTMAAILKNGIEELGYTFYSNSSTNQIFPIFPDKILEKIRKEFIYTEMHRIDNQYCCVRLVTSWATKESECRRFVELLSNITKK